MLYASEVAGLVGLNRFKPLSEAFEAVWARTDPEGYARRVAQVEAELGPEGQVRLLNKEQQAELILQQQPPLGAALASALEKVEHCSNEDLASLRYDLQQLVRKSLPGSSNESSRTLLNDYMAGQLSKRYGVLNEARGIEAYERIAGVVVRDNNRLFYAREIAQCELDEQQLRRIDADAATAAAAATSAISTHAAADHLSLLTLDDPSPPLLRRALWVGGRVDGFRDNNDSSTMEEQNPNGRNGSEVDANADTGASGGAGAGAVFGDLLIELKNRTRRFMRPLPLYDRCQMECYLQITERARGELVERLRVRVTPDQAARNNSVAAAVKQKHAEQQTQLQQCDNAPASIEQEGLEQRMLDEQTRDPEPEDVDFLASQESTAATAAATAAASIDFYVVSDASSEVEDAINEDAAVAAAAAEVDSSFLADTSPLSSAGDVEEDSSFLDDSAARAFTTAAAALIADPDGPAFDDNGDISGSSDSSSTLIREQLSTAFAATNLDESDPSADEGMPAAGDALLTAGEEEEELGLDTSFVHAAPLVPVSALPPPLRSPSVPAAAASSASVPASLPPSPPPSLFIDQLKRTPLERDDAVWSETILPSLRRFGEFMTRFLASPALQRQYLHAWHRGGEAAKLALLADIQPGAMLSSASSSSSSSTPQQQQLQKNNFAAAEAQRQREWRMALQEEMAAAEPASSSSASSRDVRSTASAATPPSTEIASAAAATANNEDVEPKKRPVASRFISARRKRTTS
jgi:hypothetical protein